MKLTNRERGKRKEEKRSKERRKCEKKGKIAGLKKKRDGKREEQPLAAMGLEFEVDKERNMGNHR